MYRTKLLAKRIGLCSTWLASLNIGDKIPVWIQKGTFKFPYSQVNILLIKYESIYIFNLILIM